MAVTNEERRRALIAAIRAAGRRTQVSELVDQLGVSIETVRRDLAVLEEQGFVRRTHGGVYPVDNAGFESSIDQRSSHMVPEKRRIAEAAGGLVGTATSIFLDDGYTPRLVGEALAAQDRALTVITPSLPLAVVLATAPRVEVILLGGRVRGLTLGTAGHWAIAMLAELVLDLAVLGTNGISLEHGLTTPSPEVSAVKAAVVTRARRRLFVGVHTKFGTDSFARFATVDDFETLVTDRGLSSREAQRYADRGPRVVRV